jgi:hypothetical protein
MHLLVTISNGLLIFFLLLALVAGLIIGVLCCAWATNTNHKELMSYNRPSDSLHLVD